ncbi:MAG: hypothetical protein M3129_06450 [Thermoproteota archaeon]|nr:hypothetical protein [Thermoproteota archaeon]
MDSIREELDASGESNSKVDQGGRAKKTRTVTFRVDSRIIDGLQREADNNGISLNILVNQLLKRYYDWGKYESKLNMIPVPKVILSSCIDMLVEIVREIDTKRTEEYRNKIVRHAAEIAFDAMIDAILLMKNQYNLWDVLEVLRQYMKASGIKADHRIAGRKNIFVIQHEMGENLSLFTQDILKLIFERLAKVKIESKITPNTTVVEVTL